MPISWDCEPSLTVAVQPAYDLGRCATELLLKRINGAGSPVYEEIVLPVAMIVRQSTGPVR